MTSPYYSSATARIVERLSNELGQGILLYGPEGVGLDYTAGVIARAHTKEIVTVKPDNKGTISIDTIRELYSLGRSKAGYTVFIIEDADTMGREAQNALLKLLEEPAPSIHFILTSHVPDRLLQTIRSRVQQYVLPPVGTEDSLRLLQELGMNEPTKRAQLLFIADGLPAALTHYATNEKRFAERSATVRDARSFLQGSRENRLLIVASYKDRHQALGLVRDMLKLLRRSVETNPKNGANESFDALLSTETALVENASVRLSLTELALLL